MPRKAKKKTGKKKSAGRKPMSAAQAFGHSTNSNGGGGGLRGAKPVKASTRKANKKALSKRSKPKQKAAKKAAGKAERRAKRKGRTEKQTAASVNNLSKRSGLTAKGKSKLKAEKEAILATPGPATSGRRGKKKGGKKGRKSGVAAGPGAWRKSKVTTTSAYTRKNKRGKTETRTESKTLVLNPKSLKHVDIWAYAGGIVTLAVSFVALGTFHSYIVNRAPAGGKHAFIGKDATLRKMARPTAVVYASSAGLAVVALAAAGYLRKSHPVISGLLGGVAAGGFLYPTVLFLKHEVAGRLFRVAQGNEVSFANIAFPDVQMNVQASLQQLIDAQNADPAGFIGQQESAPGFGDPTYAYGQLNGTPIPGVDGTGANLGIVVAAPSNASNGILVRILDPNLGLKKVSHVGAVQRQNVKNAAAGCGGNCGKPCCGGKKDEESTEEILAEAAEFEKMANGASGADRDNFLAAAKKRRAEAEARGAKAKALPAANRAAAASPKPGDDVIEFGGSTYRRVQTQPRSAAAAAATAGVPQAPEPNVPMLPEPRAISMAPSAASNAGARPVAHVPRPLSRVG
jgi:hypothetical protein